MSGCCSSPFCSLSQGQFTSRVAARQLARYRRKGPPATTRLLRDGLRGAGPLGGSLLDIGAGVGILTLELLALGVQRATAVDASEWSVAAGRQESARRGYAHAVEWTHADFVDAAAGFRPATLVTLDRVVCCYPAPERLLAEAMRCTEQRLALSYPNDRWYVRAVVALENAVRRLTRNPFRGFVHRASTLERLIRDGGFRLVSRRATVAWCADVYVRANAV